MFAVLYRNCPFIVILMKSEEEYKEEIVKELSADFFIEPEAEGKWPLDGRTCRLDFLLTPKPHLVENGFDAETFGIEVKSPKSKESVKKLLDCILQAYTYTLCEFTGRQPAFVVIYPEIKEFFQYDFENKYKNNEINKFTNSEVRLIKQLMQRANIGEIKIKHNYFKIFFTDCYFYDKLKGRSKIKNLGMVRRIGSKKSI